MGTSPYGTRILVAVKPTPNAKFMFGFPTNTSETQRTQLGQVIAITTSGGYIANLALGVNSPKPARMRKYRSASQTGTTSGGVSGGFDTSFCDVTKINDAIKAGWKMVSKYKQRKGDGKLVYVTIGAINPETGEPIAGEGMKYAWLMPQFLRQAIKVDLEKLGIKISNATDDDLVIGARYPKPPRATYITANTEGLITRKTTFCDPSVIEALPSGWRSVSTNA